MIAKEPGKNKLSVKNHVSAGLYIHVPFCKSKCSYCSFYSTGAVNLIPEYLVALKKELAYYRDIFSSFDTIYIGGGTPSLLNAAHLENIFSAIHKTVTINQPAEITLEVNPGDISPDYLKSLLHMGINRLNIGVQSFNDKILKFLGRRHSAHEATAAIADARKAGFDNLGIDLIYGVHGGNLALWSNTLRKAVSFEPEHISCYQLSLDKKTPLDDEYSQKGLRLPDEKEASKLFLATDEILVDAGYIHYEVSNFARSENLQSLHNMKYWEHVPYLGLGPAAHSFSANWRRWNKSSVRYYLQKISRGRMPVENSETLTHEQLQLEALFLGLRTSVGINLRLFNQEYGADLLVQKKAIIETLQKNNLVKLHDGFLSPTIYGLAIADSLALI